MDNDIEADEPIEQLPGGSGEPDGRGPGGVGVKTWIISGVAAVVIAGGLIFGIRAATVSDGVSASSSANSSTATGPANGQPGFPGGGVFGTVASVNGDALTVTDRSGQTTKVATTADTTVTRSTVGAASDLKVGDNVSVMGSGTATAIAAERISDSGDVAVTEAGPGGTPPAGGQAPSGAAPSGGPSTGQAPPDAPAQDGTRVSARGVIASIDGTTVSVTASDGTTVTVTMSDSTTVSIVSTIKVSDLVKGDSIMARGAAADGTLTATSITTGVAGGMPGGGTPPSGAPGASAPNTGSTATNTN